MVRSERKGSIKGEAGVNKNQKKEIKKRRLGGRVWGAKVGKTRDVREATFPFNSKT